MTDKTPPSDPHPSNEENYDQQRHPGGAHPPKDNLGHNSGAHDGAPDPKPDYRNKREAGE